MKKLRCFFALLFPLFLFAQESESIGFISEVVIDAYKKPQKFISSTKSVAVSSPIIQDQNTPERLLESFNLLPGTKMEERSPGSYRLSVRGSTLRSPFGVRNVKIYLDDFMLTDPTGNTYINVLDPELISRMEVYRGPEGGDFGSVTGGTVLLKTANGDRSKVGLSAGSYGLFKESFHKSEQLGNHFIELFQSFYRADSYRENSATRRGSFFIKDQWNYRENSSLNFMLLFSDLHYETPGGLTLAQMQENRRQARPKTATLPGAAAQQAGIFNRFFLTGVSHQFDLTPDISHFVAVQSGFVGLQNPFITNYEKKNEDQFAVRTHFNYQKSFTNWNFQSRLGFEGGISDSSVKNFDNNLGVAGNPQNIDDISTKSSFVFLSQKADFLEKIFADASLSYNFMKYNYQRIFPTNSIGETDFKPQWLPDFGISWVIADGFSLRGKIGKGNSAPTSEEIRSSDQRINTGLMPEYGWNKEIGIRKQFGNFLFTELSAFDFRLKDAIVRRQNDAGQEFFVNAGGTVQKGMEFLVETKRFRINSKVLKAAKLWVSGNLYDFKFTDYQKDNSNFSGNKIPGVPEKSVQGVMSFRLFRTINADFSHFYTSGFYLNDANSVDAGSQFYGNLLLKFVPQIKKIELQFYLQVQNLYNNDLVFGYDSNAFGGRYYNPSAKRNFRLGLNLNW